MKAPALVLSLFATSLLGCGDDDGATGESDAGCARNEECADLVGCTDDRCVNGFCVNQPADELCVDALGGSCVPEDPARDLRGCIYTACEEASCAEALTDTGLCQVGRCDGDTCVAVSTCGEGESCCGGECVRCDDGNPCTTDVCDGDGCLFVPAGDTVCDDGDPCTLSDSCQEDGTCGGVTCEARGLSCGPEGCGGCDEDSDCMAMVTDFGPCMFGAANTPAACTGTQTRTVSEGSCSLEGTCVFVDRTETQSCRQEPDSDVRCGADEVTAFGVCDYESTCDEEATQERMRSIFRCAGETCESREVSDPRDVRMCSRDTDGSACSSSGGICVGGRCRTM
ncbi:MAG: hypothetical protein AAGE52_24495 [Myxococcota bacterium]